MCQFKKVLNFYLLFAFILLTASVGFLPVRAQAESGVESHVETGWGLHTVKFQTPEGEISVRLPDDMAAGDTLSGSVVARPRGSNMTEIEENSDELNGYVVDLGQKRTPVASKVLKWTVPTVVGAGGVAMLILRDSAGKEVAKTAIPVISTPPSMPRPEVPAADDFSLPKIGQAGRPLSVTGAFDGDFDSTGVKVGGRDMELLAESPRKAVAKSPRDIIGPTTIELKEGGVVTSGRMNNVKVRLSAQKTTLLKDESTTLGVNMSGLEGIEAPVYLTLRNNSPEVVSMSGGDMQTIEITPGEASSSGVFSFDVPLTGVMPGDFNIQAQAGDCEQWVEAGEEEEWGEWKKRKDGTSWRDGKLYKKLQCVDPGKGHITKRVEIGKVHEEKTAYGRSTVTSERPAPGGGTIVRRETRRRNGRVIESSEVEYSNGKKKRVTERDKFGKKTEWEYDENGELEGVKKMDKKGRLKDEWEKQEDGKWYKQRRGEWVENDKLPKEPENLPEKLSR